MENMIDSHQHFWQVGRFDYPWMSPEVDVLCHDYLPAALASVLNRNRVDRTILVQASNSLEETRWLLSLADQHAFIGGIVGWVDLESAAVARQFHKHCSSCRVTLSMAGATLICGEKRQQPEAASVIFTH